MMANLDDKTRALAGQILKRPLSDEEQLEIYRISDAVGMRDVHSFLHLLLVFKLHEDTMAKQFDRFSDIEKRLNGKISELKKLEEKINSTIKISVASILQDGGEQIGGNLAKQIVKSAEDILDMYGNTHLGDGLLVMSIALSAVFILSYQLGALVERKGSVLEIGLNTGWYYVGCIALGCGLIRLIIWGLANKGRDTFWPGLILQGIALVLLWAICL
jgi:hypothetical protein